MKKMRNGFFINLRYICIILAIAFGLIAFVDCGGGGGGGGGDSSPQPLLKAFTPEEGTYGAVETAKAGDCQRTPPLGPLPWKTIISNVTSDGFKAEARGYTYTFKKTGTNKYSATYSGRVNPDTLDLNGIEHGTINVTLTSNTTATYQDTGIWEGDAPACNFNITATITKEGDSVLKSPTALIANTTSSASIKLMWQDNADNEDAYIVERSEVSSTDGFSEVDTLPADTQSYTDLSLTPSTMYYYRVTAYNTEGYSDYSNVASAETDPAPLSSPDEPLDLNGSATSSTSVNLFWTDTSDNESRFDIYQSSSPAGPFALAQSVPPNTTSATIDGLTPSTTYEFKVVAVNSAGNSPDSNIHEITTPDVTETPPIAPSGLSVGSATSSSLTLTWKDNSNNETGFKVYRSSTQSGTYNEIATTTSASYTNTGLSASTTYWYKVEAYNSAGTSAQTAAASGQTQAPPATIPAAPSDPAVSSITANSSVFSWIDNSDNETGFQIGTCTGLSSVDSLGRYRCATGFSQIGQVGANVTSVTLTDLNSDSTYSYFVRAYNSAGSSNNIGIEFTTAAGMQTKTFTVTASNLVYSSSLDQSNADATYQNYYPQVGINWWGTVAQYPNTQAYAGFVAFDLSSLNGKTIDSATLNLETLTAPVGSYPQGFEIGAVATSWTPSTLTWNATSNFQYYKDSWQSFSYPTYSGQEYNIDLTDTVQNWADGIYYNYGLIIESTNMSYYPGNITSFDSYNFYKPTLTVAYH